MAERDQDAVKMMVFVGAGSTGKSTLVEHYTVDCGSRGARAQGRAGRRLIEFGQVLLDGEHVRVILAECAQGVGEFEQVVAVASARTG